MWHNYMDTRNKFYFKRFKELRNKIRNETRKIQQLEQSEVASKCKLNPKKFWSYIRCKSNMATSIGDIKVKLNDQYVLIEDDDKKAQTFCDYFSSVFTEESLTNIPNITAKSCIHKNTAVLFSESQILDKLNKLNCTKSPGPDALHPRILYELREYIAYPLKLIFAESYKIFYLRVTKLVTSINKLSYSERLKCLKLPTLTYRRHRGDMIEVYKIISGKYDNNIAINLAVNKDSRTRGNLFKLQNKRFHYDIRKFSFSIRIVNVWNSLPNRVVEAESVDAFKRRLDKFWADQSIIVDYKAELTGLTNRSKVYM